MLNSSYAGGIILYLSVIEKRKTIELAKPLALQAEERSKCNLKLLGNSFELEKERPLPEAAEACDKTALAELETQHNKTASSSSSRTSSISANSLNNKILDSLFFYDTINLKQNLLAKIIYNPC